ncbi:MAG: histidine--tRNA ligase [Proteobacteria bacterium]|nr:histidine--tRNA ligase [Pseudomonadota bacterium]
MSALQPVRGTRDIMPEEMRRQRRVVETACELAARYGYLEMSTPIFEFTDVFRRPLGETSDVVSKEMYTFTDRGDEGLTLRPEATAAVCRAFLSEGLTQQLPCKFFCHGPMFRYDRPQKGRWRQFHQINVELIGVSEPLGDVETIALAVDILEALGVLGKTTLELNSLGDPASRKAYRAVLIEYFNDHRDRLSPDSRARLTRNPLRILDSKDKGDRRVCTGAPVLADYLNQQSIDFFAKVRQDLEALDIAYSLNTHLVRGLDYYTHTIFEFTTEELGAQGSVLGGGRYDGLIELLGGPPTPGVGWAGGIERLAMLLESVPAAPRAIVVVPIGAAAEAPALTLTRRLRLAGFTVELGFSGNVGKRLRRANKLSARAAVLLGEDELAQNAATVRDLESGEQEVVSLDALTGHLARFR